ncbi:hypothetical protein PRZ48_006711 [Zasmidium cellare]|uniref:Uncharacterized protein n=1 Tax=Zasmidium cellare TaxID=395010 RepID=A0ABR0EQ08_ZASCE|nr:hypothetical protein PRZ48_006711 [Zasmidium cellare]
MREVRLWERIMGAEPDYSEYAHLIRPLEDATSMLSHGTGCLETLHFAGPAQGLTVKAVEEWGIRTDLSAIKKLILECNVPPPVLGRLTGCCFSSLTVLSLELRIEPYHHYSTPPTDDTSKSAANFLCSIPPLAALKLSGELDYHRLRDVVRYHGQNLRNEHEVAAYSSIGNIRTLQSLALTLDASDYLSMRGNGHSEDYLAEPKAHFDDFGREDANLEEYNASHDPRKGHIMDMFANAALDKKLAQSIYSVLMEARPARSLALDTIELQSDGCGDFGTDFIPPAVALVANEIQHRWLFRRTYGPQSSAFDVSELEHTNRLATWDESTAGILDNESDEVSKDDLDGRIEPIFRRLWPAKAGGSVWHEDWHGFELAK